MIITNQQIDLLGESGLKRRFQPQFTGLRLYL